MKKNKFLVLGTLILIGVLSAILIKFLIPKQSKTETNELYCFRIADEAQDGRTIKYSLSSLTFEKGRFTGEKELAVFDSSKIYSCYMLKECRQIFFLTGDALFSFDLKTNKQEKVFDVLWSSTRVLDWFKDGKSFIYVSPSGNYDIGIAGIDESLNRSRLYYSTKPDGLWHILDAKIRPGSDDKELISYGMSYDADKDKLEGFLISMNTVNGSLSVIRKDRGIFDLDTFLGHFAYETTVSIAISNDGEKVAYFADLDIRDSKNPDKEKQKKTAAWVVDLDKKAKPRFVTYADGVNGWMSWSKDDKYLIVSGRLFKAGLWGFSEVKDLENLASEYKVLDRCSYEWSSDSDYFAFGNSLRENALCVTFLPEKKRTVIKGKTACFAWKK